MYVRSAEQRYANAEFRMQNSECRIQNSEFRIASLRYASLTRIYLSAECGATLARVRSAERGTRNGFATRSSANKEKIYINKKTNRLWFLDEVRSEGKLLEGSVLGVHDPMRNFFLHNAIRQKTKSIPTGVY